MFLQLPHTLLMEKFISLSILSSIPFYSIGHSTFLSFSLFPFSVHSKTNYFPFFSLFDWSKKGKKNSIWGYKREKIQVGLWIGGLSVEFLSAFMIFMSYHLQLLFACKFGYTYVYPWGNLSSDVDRNFWGTDQKFSVQNSKQFQIIFQREGGEFSPIQSPLLYWTQRHICLIIHTPI